MKKYFLLSIFVSLGFARADLVPALPSRAPEIDLQARSELNPLLEKRQFCPFNYGICVANDGTAICGPIDEVCCQLEAGTAPFTCPLDHPYCCGLDLETGIFLCGADAMCGAAGFIKVTAGPEATQTTGVPASTKKATAAPSATRYPNSPQPTMKTGEAVGMGTGKGLAVVAVLAVLIGMKVLL